MDECRCAIADSFNVRPSDLVNPRCPIHGAGHIDSEKATERELSDLINEDMYDLMVAPGRSIITFQFPYGPADLARKLLSRYDIRRK